MRVFITGGTGFIGKALVPILISNGYEILLLSRGAPANRNERLRLVNGDLSEPETYIAQLKSFNPDCAVHLAWEGIPDYSVETCRANFLATLTLFQTLCRLECKKVVAIGACWEYGNLEGKLTEDVVGRSLNLFAAFKHALSHIGANLFESARTKFVWVRPFFVYGPHQRSTALIPTVISVLRQGGMPSVRSPLAINDYIYVDDVATGIFKLIESMDASGIYNLGSGKTYAVWEVVNLVASHLGKRPIYPDGALGVSAGFWADTTRL
jgi:nucleoside-diphosphate-sugar epimerase